jgi:hypothetical protein
LHQQQVFREVFALEARAETTIIVDREIIRGFFGLADDRFKA